MEMTVVVVGEEAGVIEPTGEACARENVVGPRHQGKEKSKVVSSSSLVTEVKRRKTRKPVCHTNFIDFPSTSSLPPNRAKKEAIAPRPLVMDILDDPFDVRNEFKISYQIGREVVERAFHDDDSSDIAGIGAMSVADRKLVDLFFIRISVDVSIWHGEREHVGSTLIRHLLYHRETNGEIISSYFELVYLKTHREDHAVDHRVHYVIPYFPEQLLTFLRVSKLERCRDEIFQKQFDKFPNLLKGLLECIGKAVLNSFRYVLLPICSNNHWHLLVLYIESQMFYHWSSFKGTRYRTLATTTARFVAQYLHVFCHFETLPEPLREKECRQQVIESLDCGVYVCM